MLTRLSILVLLGVAMSAPQSDRLDDTPGDIRPQNATEDVAARAPLSPASGRLRVLTYNIAGLPPPVSDSDPVPNTPVIGRLVNAYDLVLVQEDFWYHRLLAPGARHAHRSSPQWEEPDLRRLGDGLNRFSAYPFTDFERVAWSACNGNFTCESDCLASKGFSYARTEVGPGVLVDVYNVHFEAGTCQGDTRLRRQNVTELVAAIEARSAGVPIIVAGDLNLRPDDPVDGPIYARLLEEGQLSSVGAQAGDDHLFIRDGDHVRLTPRSWSYGDEFVDAEGRPLSDHPALWVDIEWTRLPQRR